MEDNATLATLDMARGRARWFLLPGGFWIVLGLFSIFTPRTDIRVFFAFVAFASPYLILWYFASRGKAWAFFVGVLLNALGTVIAIFTGQIIGIGISGFVTYRLWISFLDCAALETLRRTQLESASTLVIPSRISSMTPAGSSGIRLPVRIADEVEAPAPEPWKPYAPKNPN